jgi:hypothetical protein
MNQVIADQAYVMPWNIAEFEKGILFLPGNSQMHDCQISQLRV